MNDILVLLKPRWLAFKNAGLANRNRTGYLKLAFLGSIGILFWGGLFALAYRVLNYFKSVEDLGEILAYKLLSMVLLTFVSLLLFSGILTCLSKLYLSRDLPLVHAMPVPSHKIFIARWVESTIDSSWMVVIYTLPVFISFGIVFHSGPLFYLNIPIMLTALSLTASAASALLIMLAVLIVPANRIRGIFVFIGLSFFLVLFFAFRLLRPERLVDPEVFETVLIYIQALETPAPPYLPSTWAFDGMRALLTADIFSWMFSTALAWSFAGILFFAAVIVSKSIYFNGVSKTQTATVRLFKKPLTEIRALSRLPGPIRAFAAKEIRSFFRDQTQWSQLFLIAALIVIYLYNFKVLPLEKAPIKTIYLQNLLAFLNMGLATFVLSAIAARFAYPAVSLEREAFWLVKSSPIRLRAFLWTKFCIYFLPLLLLTEILVISSNWLLQVSRFMMVLSIVNVLFMVPVVVSMAIGMGAAYPDFKSENPAQSVTSFGGLLFMMFSAGYIAIVLILQAGPVYNIFMAGIRNRPLFTLEWIWITASFSATILISLAGTFLPMRYGNAMLSKLEI